MEHPLGSRDEERSIMMKKSKKRFNYCSREGPARRMLKKLSDFVVLNGK